MSPDLFSTTALYMYAFYAAIVLDLCVPRLYDKDNKARVTFKGDESAK